MILTDDQAKEVTHQSSALPALQGEDFTALHTPCLAKEGMNRFIREYLPQYNNLSRFSRIFLNHIENTLNNRPGNDLGFQHIWKKYSA